MFSQLNFSRTAVLRRLLVVALTAMSFSAASVADAATVIWSAPQTITSNTNIQNPANVVTAINYGGASISVTVAGTPVNFVGSVAPFNTGSTNSAYFDATGTTVDANFEAVLDSFAFTYPGDGSGQNSATQSFAGLSAGGTYLLQAFLSDDRPGSWDDSLTIGSFSQAMSTDPPGSSTFVNATVQLGAGETFFDLDIVGTGQLSLAILNAVVLSEAETVESAVPEPSTFGLAALGLAGLGLVAWRKRR